MITGIILGVVLLFVLVFLAKSVKIVPQARAGIVERFGRFSRQLNPGLALVFPFVDRVLPLLDLREQVVQFAPQPVITQDNVVVAIDTVLYYQITDPKSAVYEVAQPVSAIEQLTTTTLRNVVGSLDLEGTLTSRDHINGQLRTVLDEATGKWGIRVNRVEIRSIDPPTTIQEAMEKQLQAERSKRAAILQAEGAKQSQILQAEGLRQASITEADGTKQSDILRAEGERQSLILRAEGQAQSNINVFQSIHDGEADPTVLAYLYLNMLPQLAKGDANKMFVIPSEFTQALGQLASGFQGGSLPTPPSTPSPNAMKPTVDSTSSTPIGSISDPAGGVAPSGVTQADIPPAVIPPAPEEKPIDLDSTDWK